MGAMRDAMEREMALRGLAARTQRCYVGWMVRLVSATRVPAEELLEPRSAATWRSCRAWLFVLDVESGDQRGAILLQRSR